MISLRIAVRTLSVSLLRIRDNQLLYNGLAFGEKHVDKYDIPPTDPMLYKLW